MEIDWVSFFMGVGAAFVIFVSLAGYVVMDMFGAPHPRKKFWFEFWRER